MSFFSIYLHVSLFIFFFIQNLPKQTFDTCYENANTLIVFGKTLEFKICFNRRRKAYRGEDYLDHRDTEKEAEYPRSFHVPLEEEDHVSPESQPADIHVPLEQQQSEELTDRVESKLSPENSDSEL